MKLESGVFTISLDFELYWGMRDKREIEEYKKNLDGVENAISEILNLFEAYDIHSTWAVVGFLFFKDIEELIDNLPNAIPSYSRSELSSYNYIKHSSHLEKKYHFAPDLIGLINHYFGQEIASHTFSHYYSLEDGQTLEQFEADISSAIQIAKNFNLTINSLIFPRNQWNNDYLPSLENFGIECYRGNPSGWIYDATEDNRQSLVRRTVRLIDTYINISKNNLYDFKDCIGSKPYNFPASRYLRPYTKNLGFLDGLKLNRIKREMTLAAKRQKIYHMWWHPHNFGSYTNQNLRFLQDILDHYSSLREKYNFRSHNMHELSKIAGEQNG